MGRRGLENESNLLYSTVKCDVIKNLVKTPGPLRSTKNFRPGRG